MLRIRQIVFVVRDLAASSRRLAELLALDPPFRDPGVAEFGIDNAVFAFGDQFVELVSPVRAGTAAGRHLERRHVRLLAPDCQQLNCEVLVRGARLRRPAGRERVRGELLGSIELAGQQRLHRGP